MHNVTRTIFLVFAFKVMHRVILLTGFWKLLNRVTILSGGTCLKCLNGTTPLHTSISDCRHVGDLPGRRCLRSVSSTDLAVPQTRLQTVSDRAFCVAEPNLEQSIPSEVTSSATLSTFNFKKNYIFHYHFGHVIFPNLPHTVAQ